MSPDQIISPPLVLTLSGLNVPFLTPDDGSADLFVHHSEIQSSGFRTLAEEDALEFEVGQGHKGPCATSVVKVG